MKLLLIILTVLESLFAALSNKTLTSEFSVTMGAEQSQPMTYSGDITMQGEQFRVTMFEMEAAFDGKTFYLYQPDQDELTLSYPTERELQETNPLLFARALKDACNTKEQDSKDGKITTITLTPKEQGSGVNRITLKVEKSSLLLQSIELREAGKTTTLKTKNPAWTSAPATWTIEKEGAYVNDLR